VRWFWRAVCRDFLKEFLGRFGELVEGFNWRSLGLIICNKFRVVSRDFLGLFWGCFGVVFANILVVIFKFLWASSMGAKVNPLQKFKEEMANDYDEA
jgi:hypothetical protein